jgi:hypothetical protein
MLISKTLEICLNSSLCLDAVLAQSTQMSFFLPMNSSSLVASVNRPVYVSRAVNGALASSMVQVLRDSLKVQVTGHPAWDWPN